MNASLSEYECDFFECDTVVDDADDVDCGYIGADSKWVSCADDVDDVDDVDVLDCGYIGADDEWISCDGASALTAFATAVTVSFAAISF